MFIIFINIILIIFLPLLFIGLINRVKSIWAGRKGPGIIQPFYDFIKFLKKGVVISYTTSVVFTVTSSVYLASVLFAALLVPITLHQGIFSFNGDFILFAYILAVGKFFMIISAMDTGSSFEGMGASREASFNVFVEPAFFLLFGSLIFLTQLSSFTTVFDALNQTSILIFLIKILSVMALFIMLLVEGARVPVDDPNTHLELTMIHEVMILDNSGPDLALINYASGLKMVLLGSLITNLILPSTVGLVTFILLYLLILAGIAVLIGAIESLIARYRMNNVPKFIFVMFSVSLIVLAAVIFFKKGNLL